MRLKNYTVAAMALVAMTAQARVQVTPSARMAEPEQEIDIRLKVDYDESLYPNMTVQVFNSRWSFILDEVDRGDDGYLHFTDEPGLYTLVAEFRHVDHDATTYVIKEDVTIQEGDAPIVFDTDMAVNKISFTMQTPGGADFSGVTLSHGEQIADGAMATGGAITMLKHEDWGCIARANAMLDAVMADGKMTYSPAEADIWINDLGPNSKIAVAQVRYGRSYTEGLLFAKGEASGLGTQTVNVASDSYVNVKNRFAPHKLTDTLKNEFGCEATESYGFMMVCDDVITDNFYFADAYVNAFDNLDSTYISAGGQNSVSNGFEMLPYVGTYDCSSIDGGLLDGAGTGVLTAPMRLTGDGQIEFLHNAAVNGFNYDQWTTTDEHDRPLVSNFADDLSFTAADGETLTWGNSSPLCVASVGYRRNAVPQLRFAFVGRDGENRLIDRHDVKFEMKFNNDVVARNLYRAEDEFQNWWIDEGGFQDTQAEYRITIEDTNVLVDGLDGYNKTVIYYDSNLSLPSPPSIRSLVFKDAEGNRTDRFTSKEGARMEFYAGDFEYVDWWFNFTGWSEAKVEYSPYGENKWRQLGSEIDESKERPVAYGSFFTTQLEDVTLQSETGWYDVRIKITDGSDNYQQQTISPAFKIGAGSGVAVMETEETDGRQTIYTIDGLQLDEITAPGLYIVGGKKTIVK